MGSGLLKASVVQLQEVIKETSNISFKNSFFNFLNLSSIITAYWFWYL